MTLKNAFLWLRNFLVLLFSGRSYTADSASAPKILPSTKPISKPNVVAEMKPVLLITIDDLLMNRAQLRELPPEIQGNLLLTCDIINEFLIEAGIDIDRVKVNDGLRIRGKQNYGAPQSQHYLGNAVDLDDDSSCWFAKVCLMNLPLMKRLGIFMEDPRWTNGINPKTRREQSWVHLQRVPPKSGRRIFMPNPEPPLNPKVWNGIYDRKEFDVAD